MELNLYKVENGKFVLKGRLPFASLVWEERINESGSMQAVFPKDAETQMLVTVGTFVELYSNPDIERTTLMYVHSVKTTDTEVWAYGYEAKELLKKQVFVNKHEYHTENILTMIETLEMFIGYSWYSGITVSASGLDVSINIDAMEFESAYDFLQSIAAMYDKGFTVLRDHYENTAGVYIFDGEDKTTTQIYAMPLGNLDGYSYTETDKGYVDRVYVYGSNNITVYADQPDTTGENYCAMLDLRTDYPKPDGMSNADYQAALTTRARQSLAQRKRRATFEAGNILQDSYASALWLGDTVRVVVPELDIDTSRKIRKIVIKIEGGAITKQPTLG